MGIISAGLTDIGMKRSSNQDSIFLSNKLHFYLVADGMGGHKGGDIASQLAVQTMQKFLHQPHPVDDAKELLRECIQAANMAILGHAQQNSHLQGMGTTVVSLLFKDSTLHIGSVGDSRAYLINKGLLYQLSKDHSLVQEKINLGIYTREDGQKDKMKNVLVRSVGLEEKLDIDVLTYAVHKNDIFLICSDGLHAKVSDQDIVRIINRGIPDVTQATPQMVEETVKKLVALANANGGQDNISVIISITQ